MATALFGVSEGTHVALETGLLAPDAYLSLLHPVFEALFIVVLALAMLGFYSAWNTGFSKARSSGTSKEYQY